MTGIIVVESGFLYFFQYQLNAGAPSCNKQAPRLNWALINGYKMNQPGQIRELQPEQRPQVFELKYAPPAFFEKMGGKAATLAKLLRLSFPVPPGVSVLTSDLSAQHWDYIREWANVVSAYPVAVRSSAQGEDGREVSYAGQFKTFLNVRNEAEVVTAVQNCFDSVRLASGKSYSQHFEREEIPMRVLIQKMINPKFSGVFFSHDPRNQGSGWIIESVEGLGEKLVSGQVTPSRFFENQPNETPSSPDWKAEYLLQIAMWAKKAEISLGYPIDMEWAIDQNSQFWILQVRPITTQHSDIDQRNVLKQELERLNTTHDRLTVWDGHSFAELSGVPSEFTYGLWKDAFLTDGAFDQALKLLGYRGVGPLDKTHPILLDRVFGRSFLNLKNMEPIYFGKSPYKIVSDPRPHLEFDAKKLTMGLILRAPGGILQMLKVAWIIQTQRGSLAKKAQECLIDGYYNKRSPFEIYTESVSREPSLQLAYLEKTCRDFTSRHLLGSFLITLLIESTVQGILAILTKDLGAEKAMEEAQHFLGENLRTAASEMSESLIAARNSPDFWNSFISRYGHRGLGELELSHARWIETRFHVTRKSGRTGQSSQVTPEARIESVGKRISKLRRPILLQEIKELQNLLQIREEIKMHIMKPYADIRYSLLALAKIFPEVCNTGDDIFWLNLTEIAQLTSQNANADSEKWKQLIRNRRETARIFKSVEIPMSFSIAQLEDVLTRKPDSSAEQVLGVSLSPGIAYGIVHRVENPESENPDSWPENTILVAEATDPGWTPLFEKAKGIIVARGGILSHCAIVAREMGLPAVGEICGAGSLFKEGEYVWVDGINGTIRRVR